MKIPDYNKKIKHSTYLEMIEEISRLKEELIYENQVINDVIEWQEEFLEYLNNKIKDDETNKKIYEEIINEFEKMMI